MWIPGRRGFRCRCHRPLTRPTALDGSGRLRAIAGAPAGQKRHNPWYGPSLRGNFRQFGLVRYPPLRWRVVLGPEKRRDRSRAFPAMSRLRCLAAPGLTGALLRLETPRSNPCAIGIGRSPRRLDGSKADGIGIGGLSVQESTTPSPGKKHPRAVLSAHPATAPRSRGFARKDGTDRVSSGRSSPG